MKWNKEALQLLEPNRPKKGVVSDAVWPQEPPKNVVIVAVGEAPGATEVVEGIPFVGRAGKLLHQIFESEGVEGQVHYTNASLYRPTPRGSQDSRPSLSTLRAERARLLEEIRMTNPKAVVALGATAALALAPHAYRVRGRVIDVSWLGNTFPVYLSWHPAYVFREPDVYSDIVQDVERAIAGERPRKPAIRASDLRTPDAKATIAFEGPILTVDIETTGTPVHLSDCVCGVFEDANGYWLCNGDNAPAFARALKKYKGRIVGHNTAGDESVLRRIGIEIRFTDDTLLQHLAHDSRKGSHGLKTLAPVIGGVDTLVDLVAPFTGKGNQEKSGDDEPGGWASVPIDVLTKYCAGDCAGTTALHARLNRLEDERTSRLYRFLMRCQRNFTEGLQHGIRIDRKLLAKEYDRSRLETDRLRKEFSFDIDSNSETLQSLVESGYNVKNTRKETLARLEGPLPEAIKAYRKEAKLFSSFLKPLQEEWLGNDGILHPLHKLSGTGTGRTSSSEPNVQQIPERLKKLFIARSGRVLLGWDFKANEVRGLAYFTRDEALLRMLSDPDADPHSLVAREAGIERSQGKRSLFGRAYGASLNKLMETGLTKDQAQRAIDTVDAMFPRLYPWRLETIELMDDPGYLETPFGRRRYFPYVDHKNRHHLENVACNFPPQSLCNDVALNSGLPLYEVYHYPTLLFIHDFVLLEVPEREAEKVKAFVETNDPWPNERVRFLPEVHIADTWGGFKNVET